MPAGSGSSSNDEQWFKQVQVGHPYFIVSYNQSGFFYKLFFKFFHDRRQLTF
jgi:hypothetical protein